MATFRQETIDGYENFQARIQQLSSNEPRVIILFCGNDLDNGTNWCPDCRDLDMLLEELRPELKQINTLFIRVKVGDRDTWKSPNCLFRTDEKLKLTSIPTLMNWKTGEKEFDLKTLLTADILLSKFGY